MVYLLYVKQQTDCDDDDDDDDDDDSEAGDDDYVISCLLMVFIAVALPRLARTDNTAYKAALEGMSTGCTNKLAL